MWSTQFDQPCKRFKYIPLHQDLNAAVDHYTKTTVVFKQVVQNVDVVNVVRHVERGCSVAIEAAVFDNVNPTCDAHRSTVSNNSSGSAESASLLGSTPSAARHTMVLTSSVPQRVGYTAVRCRLTLWNSGSTSSSVPSRERFKGVRQGISGQKGYEDTDFNTLISHNQPLPNPNRSPANLLWVKVHSLNEDLVIAGAYTE